MVLSTGDRLGPYEILTRIGAGGMGEVWKARDTRLHRIVAVKCLAEQHNPRFEREARSIAALNHPNICTLYDVGPDYLVMEYVDGSPLKGPVTAEEAIRLGLQIAAALEAAHAKGIIHLDLKPDNILVTDSGIKLLDFGLAKFLGSGGPEGATRTLEGTVAGTAPYMSPEQARGEPVDSRSDIFSFGAVLYELLGGRRAFTGSSIAEILSAVLRDEPVPLDAPAELVSTVSRCLRKPCRERYASMAEVRAALERVRLDAQKQTSIAVLPFANMSADRDQDYFSDGLAEEIMNSLARLPGLNVTARTSAFSFRGKDVGIRDIAQKLNVEHILEGSVRRSGNRIRVTAQLIKADTGFHLWSERYDRELTDIFEVQDDISAAISENLRLRLTSEDKKRLAKRYTNNLEAYEAYLQARFHLYRYTPEGLEKGLQFLHRATGLEPEYALAHAGIAEAYAIYSGFQLTGAEAMPKAQAAAARALELDDRLAEAHAALAITKTNLEWDWPGAEREFRRAIELHPGHAAAHDWFGFHLALMGRFDEAVRELERAIELDPLSPAYRADLGEVYRFARRFDAAIENCEKAIAIDPKFWLAYLVLGAAHSNSGNYAAATAVLRKGRLIEYDILFSIVEALTLARTGDVDGALRVARDLEALRATRPAVPLSLVAAIYGTAGDRDRAFQLLEEGLRDRETFISFLNVDPSFDPLRSDARFTDLLRRLNL